MDIKTDNDNDHDIAADFYSGRGVTAEYLGTILGMGAPDTLGAFTKRGRLAGIWGIFQSIGLDEYRAQDFREFAHDLCNTATWPHAHSDSRDTPWVYAYDTSTVYVYHYGVEVALIRCNYRHWRPAHLVSPGGTSVQEEFVPRRTSRFPTFSPVTDTEG